MDFNRTVPYVRKKGIAGFFQLIFHNFFDIIMLNLLFVFTSLPIFTVGASLLAVNKMTLRMVQDEPTSFFKEYFHYFKAYFKDGVISGIFFTAALAATGFSFIFYYDMAKTYPILYALSLAAMICFVLLMFAAIFYFPMLCSVRLKKRQILKNSFILSISYFKRTILAAAVCFVCAVLLYAFFPYSIPFAALGPVSFSALAACCAAWEPIQNNVLTDTPKDEE